MSMLIKKAANLAKGGLVYVALSNGIENDFRSHNQVP